MIPKDSTPIKNKILIDILAKGLLSKDEMRIIAYIIRWSWGFNGIGRRQDWTKELNITKISKDTNIGRPYCNRLILKMIKEKKIIVKNNHYQFNEHFERWIKVIHPKDRIKVIHKVDKSYPKSGQNLSTNRIKVILLGTPNNQGEGIKNKDVRGGKHLSKETLKDNKETLKERKFLNNKIPEKKNKLSREQIELNKRCITKFGKFLKGLKKRGD